MSQQGKKPEDRRRQPRAEVSFPVSYKVLDESGEMRARVSGSAINVSGTGIRFQTDEPLESGVMVVAEFKLPASESEMIAAGRVVWSRRSDAGGYEVGVEFWWLGWRDEDAQQSLAEYIQRKIKEAGQ